MTLKKNLLLLPFLLALSLTSSCSAPRKIPETTRPRTIILSLDGLRPEFLTDSGFETPTLKSLTRNGASSTDVVSIYPSVTYPSHTTLMTGVDPAQHGVLGNRTFSLKDGPTPDWYWNASDIRVPALWQIAHEASRSVAILNWPASAGARADWVVPEIFPKHTFAMDAVWEETARHTDPALMRELSAKAGTGFTDTLQKDAWMMEAARHLLAEKRPELLILHLAHGDLVQHFNGRDSKETHEAWKRLDELVRKLADELDPARDCLFIVGDHGFIDVQRLIHVNVLFAREGWLQATSDGKRPADGWEVIADLNGAQASVYLRNPALGPRVLALLRKHAGKDYLILDRQELDRLNAFPEAFVALEPRNGAAIGAKYSGPVVEKLHSPHGEHGFGPDVREMHTSFVANGACAVPGRKLGTIRLIDIAPSMAQAMGLQLPQAQGQALPLKN